MSVCGAFARIVLFFLKICSAVRISFPYHIVAFHCSFCHCYVEKKTEVQIEFAMHANTVLMRRSLCVYHLAGLLLSF